MNTMPAHKKISVIIPVYNAQDTILKCLTALNAQTFPPHEIIVVNDSSTDRTALIAEPYARVIPNTRAKGAGGARNTGAAAATGNILAFTDADCVPPPTWLEKIAQAFDNENIGAVAGGYSCHLGTTFIGTLACHELAERRKNFSDHVNTAVSNNFAITKDIFTTIGEFPEFFSGATAEDLILSFRISRISNIRWLSDNPVAHHFHDTLSGYLRQQYTFGRDAVIAYKKFPMLITVKTHHGRLLYLETLLAGCLLPGIFYPWPVGIPVLIMLWLLNIRLLQRMQCVGGTIMLLKTLLFIPIRDINNLRSIAGGICALLAEKHSRTQTMNE